LFRGGLGLPFRAVGVAVRVIAARACSRESGVGSSSFLLPMKLPLGAFSWILVWTALSGSGPLHGAEKPKVRVLDPFNHLDPRTVLVRNVSAKVVSHPDPAHHRVLEIRADFANPEAWYYLQKNFPPGTIQPAKHTAVRFFVRSDSATVVSLQLMSADREKLEAQGKSGIYFRLVEAGPSWTEVVVPLSEFKTAGGKLWKNGAQVVLPALEPIPEGDLARIGAVQWVFDVNRRGTSTVAHLQVEGLGLVEK
jgi:hypothetical protein